MRISHVKIKNFRNFKNLEVDIGPNLILIGENGAGKTNFLEALRLVLDPSINRKLDVQDFHRHVTPFRGTRIEVQIQIRDFKDDENLFTILCRDHTVLEEDPATVQLAYVYRPQHKEEPENAIGRDDYEAIVYGVNENKPIERLGEFHQQFNLRVIPALRDIERDIGIWRNSPLRRLVELMNLSEDEGFVRVAEQVKNATEDLREIEAIQGLQSDVRNRLQRMIEGIYSFDPQIGMMPYSPEELHPLCQHT